MISKLDICNNALSLVGQGTHIESLDEQSRESLSCNRLFDVTIERALDKFDWSFASKDELIDDKSLLDTVIAPPFRNAYSLPEDCRRVNSIHHVQLNQQYSRYVNPNKTLPYKLKNHNSKLILCTDADAPFVIQYQCSGVPLELLPPTFIEAVEYLLAGYLAIDMMKGSVGEQVGLKLQQMGYNCLLRAHDNDVQVGVEVMPQQEVHSTLVNSRRGHYYGL